MNCVRLYLYKRIEIAGIKFEVRGLKLNAIFIIRPVYYACLFLEFTGNISLFKDSSLKEIVQ